MTEIFTLTHFLWQKNIYFDRNSFSWEIAPLKRYNFLQQEIISFACIYHEKGVNSAKYFAWGPRISWEPGSQVPREYPTLPHTTDQCHLTLQANLQRITVNSTIPKCPPELSVHVFLHVYLSMVSGDSKLKLQLWQYRNSNSSQFKIHNSFDPSWSFLCSIKIQFKTEIVNKICFITFFISVRCLLSNLQRSKTKLQLTDVNSLFCLIELNLIL
jgi:hypothetical protein